MRRSFRPAAHVLALLVLLASASAILAQGRVSGSVKDDAGEPIKRAKIVARNPQAAPSEFSTVADDKGRWSLNGVHAGLWVFTASADGYVTADFRTPIAYLRANPPIEFALAKATPGIVSGAAAKELQAELKAADEMLANKQFDEAIAAYQSILVKAPALSTLNLQLARAYRGKEDYGSALAAYRAVLNAEPGLAERVNVELGQVYMQQGDVDRAVAVLEQAAKADTAGREVFFTLGEAYLAKGHMDLAARHYRSAAERDPTWTKPVLKLGIVALNTHDHTGAVTALERVVAMDSSSAEATHARALLAQLKK